MTLEFFHIGKYTHINRTDADTMTAYNITNPLHVNRSLSQYAMNSRLEGLTGCTLHCLTRLGLIKENKLGDMGKRYLIEKKINTVLMKLQLHGGYRTDG